MFWYRKTYPRFGAHWADDQTRFENLQIHVTANGSDAFKRMMMVTVEDRKAHQEDVYLRVSSRDHIRLFPGYVAASEPPSVSSLIVGDRPEFERLFGS